MNPSFKKILLAVAFSPTTSAMVAIGANLARHFNTQLVLVHVGTNGPQQQAQMNTLLAQAGTSQPVKVIWETGDPAKKILKVCRDEQADLLIAGALKRENLVKYYIGTIARKIMRKAECSVLMITNPSTESVDFKNIVVNADDNVHIENTIALACQMGNRCHASWLHIVRELKLYGLSMVAKDHCSEEEYDDVRQQLVKEEIEKVEDILRRLPIEKPKLNIKIISGKSGFELSKFAERKHADLLVVNAAHHRSSFFDRVFPHDLEYIFADLPCNLLVIQHAKKEQLHG